MKNQRLHPARKVSNYVGNPINESVLTYIDTHGSMHTCLFCMRHPPTRSRPKVKTKETRLQKNSIVSCRKTRPQLRQCMPGERHQQKPRRYRDNSPHCHSLGHGLRLPCTRCYTAQARCENNEARIEKVHSFLQQNKPTAATTHAGERARASSAMPALLHAAGEV